MDEDKESPALQPEPTPSEPTPSEPTPSEPAPSTEPTPSAGEEKLFEIRKGAEGILLDPGEPGSNPFQQPEDQVEQPEDQTPAPQEPPSSDPPEQGGKGEGAG